VRTTRRAGPQKLRGLRAFALSNVTVTRDVAKRRFLDDVMTFTGVDTTGTSGSGANRATASAKRRRLGGLSRDYVCRKIVVLASVTTYDNEI